MSTVLDYLPATSTEIAAILGVSVRTVNARLQYYARVKKAKRSDRFVPSSERRRGWRLYIWERT